MTDGDNTADPRSVKLDLDDVEVLDSTEHYRGFFELRILKLRHRLFAGGWTEPLRRELLIPHRAVGVLLFDPHRDAVALVEQFRVGVLPDGGHSPWLYELVAGVIEPGETITDVAHREAREESGQVVEVLEPIANYYSSPGICSEYFHVFCGKADLSDAGGLHGLDEENEDIRVHRFAFAEAWAMVESGEICNAHTLVAMQWLKIHHQRLLTQWR